MHPDDPVVFIGDNLTLTCEYNGTGQNTRDISGRMIFMRNRLIIGQQYITVLDVNKIRLRYPIKSTDDSANYVCMLQETGQDLKLLGHSFVEVECKFSLKKWLIIFNYSLPPTFEKLFHTH